MKNGRLQAQLRVPHVFFVVAAAACLARDLLVLWLLVPVHRA